MGIKCHFPSLVPSGNGLIMIVPLVFLADVCDLQTMPLVQSLKLLLHFLMPEALF